MSAPIPGKIMMAPGRNTCFKEFYQYYLSKHQNKVCRRLHLLGLFVAVGLFGFALFSPYWLLCACAPLAGYPFAWTGHLLFEKNQPATWTNPLFSFLADLRMTWDIARGKIQL